MRPREATYWDTEILDAISATDDSIWYRYMAEIYGDLIRRGAGPGGGRSLKTDLYEEARGVRTPFAVLPHPRAGIDQSSEVVDAARRNAEKMGLSCDLRVADVRDLPFPDGYFSLILSGSTLDHFHDRDEIFRALEELERVLAPGGTLVLTLDNPHNPVLFLRRKLGALSRLRLRPYFVGETLSASDGVDALEKAGFEVHSVRTIAHVPRDPAMRLARLVERLSNEAAASRLVNAMLKFEACERAPTHRRTGYYLAFQVSKPSKGSAPTTHRAAPQSVCGTAE